jgi:hypothetical protein
MEEKTVNPDEVCQRAVHAKMAVYQAKEHFEVILKGYNDQVDALIGVVDLMKRRILELEKQVPTSDK